MLWVQYFVLYWQQNVILVSIETVEARHLLLRIFSNGLGPNVNALWGNILLLDFFLF